MTTHIPTLDIWYFGIDHAGIRVGLKCGHRLFKGGRGQQIVTVKKTDIGSPGTGDHFIKTAGNPCMVTGNHLYPGV